SNSRLRSSAYLGHSFTSNRLIFELGLRHLCKNLINFNLKILESRMPIEFENVLKHRDSSRLSLKFPKIKIGELQLSEL
ncbi:4524_t:CDS:1, partial [Dentiscutata heterogama]